MKQQLRSVKAMEAELRRQVDAKHDYDADTRTMALTLNPDNVPVMDLFSRPKSGNQIGRFEIGDIAHQQVATHYGIYKPYYDKLRTEQPQLFVEHLNGWFQSAPSVRRVRTLDDRFRAFLSVGYNIMDNPEFVMSVLPTIREMGVNVKSAAITEARCYIKFILKDLSGNIKTANVKDVIYAGGCLSNSEVGLGSYWVAYLDYWLACKNGMIAERVFSRAHLGRRDTGESDQTREFLRDETKALEDATIISKMRDILTGMFQPKVFQARIDKYNEATQDEIIDVVETVEVVGDKFNLTDGQRRSVLTHLIDTGEKSRYGLANAITRASQDEDSYDTATNLEGTGYEVMAVPKNSWESIIERANTLARKPESVNFTNRKKKAKRKRNGSNGSN
jgi:hypothetical protein